MRRGNEEVFKVPPTIGVVTDEMKQPDHKTETNSDDGMRKRS
jgi:hypothetical protein